MADAVVIREKYCERFNHKGEKCEFLVIEPGKGSRCTAQGKNVKLKRDRVGLIKVTTGCVFFNEKRTLAGKVGK